MYLSQHPTYNDTMELGKAINLMWLWWFSEAVSESLFWGVLPPDPMPCCVLCAQPTHCAQCTNQSPLCTLNFKIHPSRCPFILDVHIATTNMHMQNITNLAITQCQRFVNLGYIAS